MRKPDSSFFFVIRISMKKTQNLVITQCPLRSLRLCVSKFFGFPLCLSELCERIFFYLVVVRGC